PRAARATRSEAPSSSNLSTRTSSKSAIPPWYHCRPKSTISGSSSKKSNDRTPCYDNSWKKSSRHNSATRFQTQNPQTSRRPSRSSLGTFQKNRPASVGD
ncbi:unnamed protein product, partial [Aphanomyces euteiches]